MIQTMWNQSDPDDLHYRALVNGTRGPERIEIEDAYQDMEDLQNGGFVAFCSCIHGKPDCPYCKGSGLRVVKFIGATVPYPG